MGEAIHYSTVTTGKLINSILKDKLTGANNVFVYMRLQLHIPDGTGAGGSYVFEIWPPNNGSPVHEHAHGYAAIKVLFGEV